MVSVFFLSLIILGGCYPRGYGMMGQAYGTGYQTGAYRSGNPDGDAALQQGENWNYCPYCGESFKEYRVPSASMRGKKIN